MRRRGRGEKGLLRGRVMVQIMLDRFTARLGSDKYIAWFQSLLDKVI